MKNILQDVSPYELDRAEKEAVEYIDDFLEYFRRCKEFESLDSVVVCRIPRSKVNFNDKQLYFQKAIELSLLKSRLTRADKLKRLKLINGIDYIKRIKDVATTHLSYATRPGVEKFKSGNKPYPGITKDTCDISDKIKDQVVLLIDDIYTIGVNVVEDCIQALYDKGAKSVIFYAVGRTVKNDNILAPARRLK